MKHSSDNLTNYRLRLFFCVLIIFLHSGTLFAEILPYTIKNGWFPMNYIEPNETRLVVEGLPSRFLIKLKEGYHIEYASLFDKGKYICYSFGERIAKGKYLDDRTVNGYVIANGPEGGYETKLVILKPKYDKSGHLIYLDSNTLAGDKITPSDNPIIDVIPIPEYDKKIKDEDIISSSTTGLTNLFRTDNPIHIKTNDGHVFCICTYSLVDNDGVKRFKGYLLSISEGNGLQKQIVKRLDLDSMALHPSNTPQLAFDESLQRLFILLDNQLIVSDDYGKNFSTGQNIQIDIKDINVDEDCNISIISSGGNGIVLKNGIICFPMNVLQMYKEKGFNEDGEQHDKNEVKHAQFFVLYSTDKGVNWQQSPLTPKDIISWESSITEFKPNRIMVNSRGGTDENWNRTTKGRRVFVSSTSGRNKKWKINSWSVDKKTDGIMWDPICNASLITSTIGKKKMAIFSQPNIPGRYMPRTNITVFVSSDYKNWEPAIEVTHSYEVTQGYSSLDCHSGKLTIVYCDYLSKRIKFVDLSDTNKLIMDAYKRSKRKNR